MINFRQILPTPFIDITSFPVFSSILGRQIIFGLEKTGYQQLKSKVPVFFSSVSNSDILNNDFFNLWSFDSKSPQDIHLTLCTVVHLWHVLIWTLHSKSLISLLVWWSCLSHSVMTTTVEVSAHWMEDH